MNVWNKIQTVGRFIQHRGYDSPHFKRNFTWKRPFDSLNTVNIKLQNSKTVANQREHWLSLSPEDAFAMRQNPILPGRTAPPLPRTGIYDETHPSVKRTRIIQAADRAHEGKTDLAKQLIEEKTGIATTYVNGFTAREHRSQLQALSTLNEYQRHMFEPITHILAGGHGTGMFHTHRIKTNGEGYMSIKQALGRPLTSDDQVLVSACSSALSSFFSDPTTSFIHTIKNGQHRMQIMDREATRYRYNKLIEQKQIRGEPISENYVFYPKSGAINLKATINKMGFDLTETGEITLLEGN